MKTLLLSAAALATVAVAPALAQTAPAHGQMAGKSVTRAEMVQKVQQHFAGLDSNNDGFVTRAESDAARATMHQRLEKRVEHRGEAMFDRMDANKDGSISRAEFDAAHQSRAGKMRAGAGKRIQMMHGAMGGRMFELADADRDGRVSLAEATSAAAAHFDRADANRDGTLTGDEMRAAHKAMRGKPAS